MPHIEINHERCKGCRLCTTACSRSLVLASDTPNSLGYTTAFAIDQERCTGCTLCAHMCPDVAITVFIEDKNGKTIYQGE